MRGKPARNNTGEFVTSVGPPSLFLPQYVSYAPRVPRSQGVSGMVSLIFVLIRFPSLHDDTGVGGNTGPKLSSLLTDRTGDGGSLHLTLGVDNL